MRKKLDTRFPAARIKKIMQADEDVGKIALAVPLLVSKALELFLQDLCNHTYGITVQRGAKTMNSMHLKQCVQTCNVFDFLREIVDKVPDLGGSDAGHEDRSLPKKRKIADDEETGSDEDIKEVKTHGTAQIQGSSKGRGRGRKRGHGRGNQTVGSELPVAQDDKFEDADTFHVVDEMPSIQVKLEDSKETVLNSKNIEASVRNFDLNVGLDENGDSSTSPSGTSPNQSSVYPKHDEYPGWSPAVVEKMGIDSIHLANFNGRVDEEDEDYD